VPKEHLGKKVTLSVQFDLGGLPTVSKPQQFEIAK